MGGGKGDEVGKGGRGTGEDQEPQDQTPGLETKRTTRLHTHTGNMAQGFGRGGASEGRGKEGEDQEPPRLDTRP